MEVKNINKKQFIACIEADFWQAFKNDDYEVWRGSDDDNEHALIFHIHTNRAILFSFPLVELDLYFRVIDMFIRKL